MTEEKILSVGIVDSSIAFRARVETALKQLPEFSISFSGMNIEKLGEFLNRQSLDVLIVTRQLPGGDAARLLQAILTHTTPLRVVIFLENDATQSAPMVVLPTRWECVQKPPDEDPEFTKLAQVIQSLTHQLKSPQTVRSSTPPTPRSEGQSTNWLVVVASSTGGPKALATFLPDLAARIHCPVLVVQHLLNGFGSELARTLSVRCKDTPYKVAEPRSGETIQPQVIYLAPTDHHMIVRRTDGKLLIILNQTPPEEGVRPAANPLFASAAIFGTRVVACILTGMGCDGTRGAQIIHDAGGHIIAQNKETSAVWGMPGSVVEAKIAHQVVPLEDMAAAVALHIRATGEYHG